MSGATVPAAVWVGDFAPVSKAASDITIFDPEQIADKATFEDPNHYSVGISYVFVNGRAVVRDGLPTEERPGQVLRGPGYRADRN